MVVPKPPPHHQKDPGSGGTSWNFHFWIGFEDDSGTLQSVTFTANLGASGSTSEYGTLSGTTSRAVADFVVNFSTGIGVTGPLVLWGSVSGSSYPNQTFSVSFTDYADLISKSSNVTGSLDKAIAVNITLVPFPPTPPATGPVKWLHDLVWHSLQTLTEG